MFEIDDGERRRESCEKRIGEGDVPGLEDFESDEMLQLVESVRDLIDRCRVLLLLHFVVSDSFV